MKTRTIACTGLLVAALVLKFALIAGMEIEDAGDDPVNYVKQILFNSGLCYGPGTGYMGRLFYDLGIPFRTGIEIAYLVAIALAVKALVEWPTKSAPALVLYLFMMFNPAPEELFSHLYSDQVWLVEILAGLALLVFSVRPGTRLPLVCAAVAGIILGFSSVTRSVMVPLMMAFAIWAAFSGVLIWRKGRGPGVESRAFKACAVCLFATIFLFETTCFFNARYNGFHGISALDCTEFHDFYLRLQSVGPATGVAYYPVDEARLKLIAQAGPESRAFVDQLAQDTSFRRISQETYGRYDLALCWFHWSIFETVDADGDTDKMFARFKAIEKEIAQAGAEKRLEVRTILPLPDCRISIVAGVLPKALWHVAGLVAHEPATYAWEDNAMPKFDNPDFTKALSRRSVTPSPVREEIGRVLCVIYRKIYGALAWLLPAAVIFFAGALTYRWESLGPLSAVFLVRQLFAVCFVVFFAWYTLFDASGLLAVSRYLIFNNVLCPALIFYYICLGLRLSRGAMELD